MKVNFHQIDNFEYTKPISFSYFEDVQIGFNSWAQLYARVLLFLSEDYPEKFLKMYGTNISGGYRIDFGTEKASKKMRHPKKISDNFYAETNFSADKIIRKIRKLLDVCNVDYENLEIYYINMLESNQKIEVKSTKKSEAITKDKSFQQNNIALSSQLLQKAENYLLQCDLTGASREELKSELNCTVARTNEIVALSTHIIEMNKRLFHVDALVDFEEGADALEAVLDKLLKKNNGIATAKHLYDYARSDMAMFFNDNAISDQQSVYDFARYLFEKQNYHGKQYVFNSNKYISLPGASADSIIDIVKKYAEEKGSTFTYQEIERYLKGLGLNTGNLRALMHIDKEPVFLVYAENEYLLAELIHIDDVFLKTVRSALRRLFNDTDGHIIPRNISHSWYNLLPTLPASLDWTPMLLQQLIHFYPEELEARTIIAMESQNSNTLHAMFVEKESPIQDFRDVVAVFLYDEMPNRCEYKVEELRKILVDAGMICDNQLINKMPNALGMDSRFLWNSDGSSVKLNL